MSAAGEITEITLIVMKGAKREEQKKKKKKSDSTQKLHTGD